MNQTIVEIHSLFLDSSGVSIDTRTLASDNIYFAIKGEHFDGNKFAKNAIEKGAKWAVVSDPNLEHENFIHVEDTLLTLQQLATFHREYLDIPIIALTGSNGKTTTKELITQVLHGSMKVECTKGNLNNHLGVPLTLLSFGNDLDLAIVEMGANHLGEIALLSSICRPNIGLITNIGRAHIGEFGGLENIKKAKTELYQFLKSDAGTIVYNSDDQVLASYVGDYQQTCAYSSVFKNGFELSIIHTEPTIEARISNGEETYHFTNSLGGLHNIENIKSAIAIGFLLGLSPKIIANQLSTFKTPDNRSQWIKTKRNNIFLDAYNANPTSVKSSIEYFQKITADYKLIILGDMFELGEYTHDEHKAIYDLLKDSNTHFYLVGNNFYNSVERDARVFQTKELFLDQVHLSTFENYHVLVKASRSMKLETIVELL